MNSLWFPDMTWRGWLSRKLLRFVVRLEPEQSFVFQAGEFKFERGWRQPVAPGCFEARDEPTALELGAEVRRRGLMGSYE
jgi:hypothetical protein